MRVVVVLIDMSLRLDDLEAAELSKSLPHVNSPHTQTHMPILHTYAFISHSFIASYSEWRNITSISLFKGI